ncbi:MAG: hypothetical protein ACRC6V_01580 [Bacteroidales bacterium]
MNLNQIEFLKALDPNQEYGTIQRILMEENLSIVPFENVAKYLLNCMVQERQTMLKENTLMQKELQKHGLYTSELLGLEG